MRSRKLFVAVALCCAFLFVTPSAFAASWGRIFTVSRTVSVRESPFDDALRVRMLKAGQRVRADFFEDGWAAVFDLRETQRSELKAMGYVRVSDLTNGRVMDIEDGDAAAAGKTVAKRAPRTEEEEAKPAAPSHRAVRSAKSAKQARADETEEAAPVVKHGVKRARTEVADDDVVKPSKSAKTGKSSKSSRKTRREVQEKIPKGFGEILVADCSLSVREDRDIGSKLKRVLRPGQKVRVDFVQGGWSAVFDPAVTTRDESLAWGYAGSKFLLTEAEYEARQSGQPVQDKPAKDAEPAKLKKDAEPAKNAKGRETVKKAEPTSKAAASVEEAIGYKVLERKADRKTKDTVLRVRLTVTRPPTKDALRAIAREIWKSEHKKGEVVQLEVLLSRMDPKGLAYAVVKFRADGRITEFWWRDTVLEDGGK